MRTTPGAFGRVALIAFAAVILQLSGFGPHRVVGVEPDLIPLAVAVVGLYGGSVAGAATGFGVGFLLDLVVGGTMGLSSLVLSAVGYGVGRYREARDPAHALMPIPVGAVATFVWLIAFAALSFMLDVGASVSPVVFRDMLLTTALNALVALPVFALCRRLLRPSLLVDPVDVRRRRQPPREAGPIGLRGLEV